MWTTPHLPRSAVLWRWCLRRTILLADACVLPGAALAARGLHQKETPRLASYIFQNTTIGYYMRLCGLIRFIYLIIFAIIIYKKTSLGMCGQHPTSQDQLSSEGGAWEGPFSLLTLVSCEVQHWLQGGSTKKRPQDWYLTFSKILLLDIIWDYVVLFDLYICNDYL